jgi:hypothetical protein
VLHPVGCCVGRRCPTSAKSIRPPEWDPKQDADKEMINNIPYDAGEKIPILYKTDVGNIELWLWKVLDDSEAGTHLTGKI